LSATFDAFATDYDQQFTFSLLGKLMRQRVHQQLDLYFKAGQHILELNCGTGEDALYMAKQGIQVTATDISAEMVQLAQQKIDSYVTDLPARTLTCDSAKIQSLLAQNDGSYQGVLSNFGGLNCITDLTKLADDLQPHLDSKANLLLCIMGPYVPWEWLWFLTQGQPKKAFRRLSTKPIKWHDLTLYYPSIRQVKQAFSQGYTHQKTTAVGALIPPSYMEEWALKHQNLIQRLNSMEEKWQNNPLLTWTADHYLIHFQRQ
jgi:SAM-dependent methyltransferase